jgi:hypothetical protein
MLQTLTHTFRVILTLLFLMMVVAGNLPLFKGRIDGPYTFALAWTLLIIGGLGSLGMIIASRFPKPLIGYFVTAFLALVALPFFGVATFAVGLVLGYQVKTDQVAAAPYFSAPAFEMPGFDKVPEQASAFSTPDFVPQAFAPEPSFSNPDATGASELPSEQVPHEPAHLFNMPWDTDTLLSHSTGTISPPNFGGPPKYVPEPNQPGAPTALVGSAAGWQFQAYDRYRRSAIGIRYSPQQFHGQQPIFEFMPLYKRDVQPDGASLVFASEGYAVGGLQIVAGDEYLNAVRIKFLRERPDGALDPSDSYMSDWIGNPAGKKVKEIGGDSARVIGICGREGGGINALGLLLDRLPPDQKPILAQESVDPIVPPVPSVGAAASRRKARPKTGENEPEYIPPPHLPGELTELVGGRARSSEGWQFEQFDVGRRLIIGFHHSMGSWDNIPSVAEFAPIYEGDRFKSPPNSLLAREGYVVGRIHVVGDRFVNAIRVEFVRKNSDGSLDSRDSYLSQWIGDPQNKKPTVLGDGQTPVIGVCGRRGAIVNAIALVLDRR